MSIEAGAVVVLYLAAPREQVFGVVLSLGMSGIVIRGISLASLDDWLRSFGAEADAHEGALGLTTSFYPMHRVERASLDEALGGIEPVQERFRERTGMSLLEFVGLADRDDGESGAPSSVDRHRSGR
jgi:hypothetical protein